MASLDKFKGLVEGEKWNLAKPAMIASGAVAGIAVMGPLAIVAGPGIAATLGGWGVLGSTAGGTAISSLSGAALTSASLAAIGGGATAAGGLGMAGGSAIITAIGGALGGVRGGVITNSYIGDIEGFDVKRVRRGAHKERLVFVNGFLQQDENIFADWTAGTAKEYPKHRGYGLTWESKTLLDLGKTVVGGGKTGAMAFLKEMAVRGGRRNASRMNPLRWVTAISDLLDNPWHVAMYKAGTTGTVLADLIGRTKCVEGHTLMGHSLGARVIYYALTGLATKDEQLVQDVVLLGGAVDRRDSAGWTNATKAVRGTIYNCYSKNDDVLKWLYKGSTALLSAPIGIGPILSDAPNIVNLDVTDLVAGHMEHKAALPAILARIQHLKAAE